MDDEKLIQLVRDFPCLYDKASKDFKDQNKKRLAWKKVGKNVGVDETVAMKRWGNLRERFSKEMRNSKRASGSGALMGRQWEFMESLQFLRAHIVPRPMRQSSQIVDCGTMEVASILCESQLSCSTPSPLAQSSPIASAQPSSMLAAEPSPLSPVPVAEVTFIPAAEPSPIPPAEPSPIPPAELPALPSAPSTSRQRKRAAEHRNELDAAILDTVKTFKEVCERKTRREEFSSDVRGFGLMMCSAISKLNEPRQALVMQRCTELVMQAQVEQHDEEQFIELCTD